MNLTFWEVAEAVAAKNDWKKWDDFLISSVEFDSRLLKENSLFVPLVGERDGHDFWKDVPAFNQKATLWERSMPPAIEEPFLQVENTLQAMQHLAAYYLKKMNPKVVAITGSNGKTTTKDLTASVLSQRYRTYKTQGNYNNHIGLPYTILHMPVDTEVLILEMGMDHQGEISALTALAQPDVAAITMIGESHIEHLGSRQNIAAAKMEIVEGLRSDGLLILPGDEPLLTPYVKKMAQNIQTFGNLTSTIFALEIYEHKKDTQFLTNLFPDLPLSIPIMGTHNVGNACISILIGRYFNLSNQEIQQGLHDVDLTQNRTQWLNTANGLEILSDVYNANPTAMKLVLDSFARIQCQGKRFAVLGDMLDLGKDAEVMHAELAEYCQPDRINEVYLYGPKMAGLYKKLAEKYKPSHLHYYSVAEQTMLITELKQATHSKDIVMVKGSHGMHMDKIVEALLSVD